MDRPTFGLICKQQCYSEVGWYGRARTKALQNQTVAVHFRRVGYILVIRQLQVQPMVFIARICGSAEGYHWKYQLHRAILFSKNYGKIPPKKCFPNERFVRVF
jgi:hypothetical protein